MNAEKNFFLDLTAACERCHYAVILKKNFQQSYIKINYLIKKRSFNPIKILSLNKNITIT